MTPEEKKIAMRVLQEFKGSIRGALANKIKGGMKGVNDISDGKTDDAGDSADIANAEHAEGSDEIMAAGEKPGVSDGVMDAESADPTDAPGDSGSEDDEEELMRRLKALQASGD